MSIRHAHNKQDFVELQVIDSRSVDRYIQRKLTFLLSTTIYTTVAYLNEYYTPS